MLRFDILTLFPDFFSSPMNQGILMRAQNSGLIEVNVVNIRDFAPGKHRIVDDMPFGGGVGMVMKAEPVIRAIESRKQSGINGRVILLTPQGEKFQQEMARELSGWEQLILVCGRYEGVDERVRDHFVDDEISIGDYVLNGGEAAALVVVEAVSRLVPGVLGNEESARNDSFSQGLLDYPQYTRPRKLRGIPVPEILLSGHHQQIELWRKTEAIRRTWERRPEFLKQEELGEEERRILEEVKRTNR
ncbi:MAG: tRNA (guanosine(37)-N1)-methyltransferase TrmD [Deltaproteobacteria bacterium]|nr:MAG: tRNA (guanosine(37)-N1)-methyltransferase TrmD [Deltaproteobacteria bacterium]